MTDPAVPAALKDMTKSDEIGIDVSGRILDRVADTRLCCEINHRIKTVFGKKTLHLALVRNIGFDEFKLLRRC